MLGIGGEYFCTPLKSTCVGVRRYLWGELVMVGV